jgi:hypothetical protein
LSKKLTLVVIEGSKVVGRSMPTRKTKVDAKPIKFGLVVVEESPEVEGDEDGKWVLGASVVERFVFLNL